MSKKLTYNELEQLFHEISECFFIKTQDNINLEKEVEFLKDFIEWKSLTPQYMYFREHAVLEMDEEKPFLRYILA